MSTSHAPLSPEAPASPEEALSPALEDPGAIAPAEPSQRWPWLGRPPRVVPLILERAPWLWPYGLLALAIAVVMRPAWANPGRLIIAGDTLLQHYGWQEFFRVALAAGQPPFWNPYMFSGVPAMPNPQVGVVYPLQWLFAWMPSISAINWLIGVHMVIAGLAAAWCASRLGASREGQFLCGVAYALGGATAARLAAGHLSFLQTDAWLPLVTGLAADRRRSLGAVLLAPALALMIVAGQLEMLIFSVWWLPFWAAFAAWRDGRAAVIGALARVGLGMALGVGLAATQLLPTMQVVAVSFRQAGVGDWDFLTGSSLPPWYLLELFSPTAFGYPEGQTYWAGNAWDWHERMFYVGILPLVAAFRASGRWRWACWIGAIVAVALAFGSYAPWYAWVQKVVPGYQNFRIPSKHLTLAALALALAAGLGIERLRGRWFAFNAFFGAALLGVASLTIGDWFERVIRVLGGADRPISPLFRDSIGPLARPGLQTAGIIMAGIGLTALLPGRWATRAQLLLAVVELTVVLGPFRFHYSDPASLWAKGEPLRGHERVAVIGPGDIDLSAVGGAVLRVVQPAGYSSLFSNAYATLLTGGGQPVLAGVGQADHPALPILGYDTIFEVGKGLRPAPLPALPRAWVAHCVWPGGSLAVREASFPRQSCIARATTTTADPVSPRSPASVLADSEWGALTVQAEGPGWLVTTEPWYPGWSAQVDGAAVPTEPVDGALLGLPLEPGPHTIALSYRPAGLELGLLISVVSAVILLVLWWLDRRGATRRFDAIIARLDAAVARRARLPRLSKPTLSS